MAEPIPIDVVVPQGSDITASKAECPPECGHEEVDIGPWRCASSTGGGAAGSEEVGLARDRGRVPRIPQQPLGGVLAAVELCRYTHTVTTAATTLNYTPKNEGIF